MNNQLKSDLMMIMVTLFWGSSYLFMKMGLQSLHEFNLIALRFGIAFLLAGIVFYKRLIKTDFKTVKYGFLLGTILFLVFVTITYGVKSTSTSNAGFLVSLAVVLVPVMSSLFFKKKPENRVIFSACLALIGIGLLTLNHNLQISQGDFFCILGAFFNATHIIVTGTLTKNVDSVALGVFQLGFTGILGFIFSFFAGGPQLPGTTESWISIVALSIFCSAIGFVLQTVAQNYTTPTHTGLIFTLESVFAALFAFLFLGETIPAKGYLGATIVLLAVINAEVNFKKLIFGKKIQQKSC